MVESGASIKKKTQESFRWSLLGEIFAKLATPLSTMVLARLLSPEIFGIATAVTIIVTFCEAISESGFSKYIIQKDFSTDEEYYKHLRGATSFSLIFSLLLMLAIILCNVPLSNFIGNAGYESILIVSSLQIPFTALNSVYLAHLKRNFKFKAVFFARIAYCLTPFVVTIPLSFFGLGPWALVIGTIASQIVQAPIFVLLSKKIIKPTFEFKLIKNVIKGSYIMIIESIIIWFCSWTSTFLATQFFDADIVGIVKVSNSTVNSIFSLFSTSFTSVLFVSLSRLKNDERSYKDVFYSIQSAAFSVLVPLGIGSFFFSELVVLIFLGSGWMGATHFVGVYSISFMITCCFNNFLSELFRSKGLFVHSIFYQIVMLFVDLIFKFTLGKISIDIYPYTNLMTNIVMTIIVLIIMNVKFELNLLSVLKNFMRTVLCSASMIPLLFSNKMINHTLFQTAGIVVCCVCIYFCVSLIFNRKSLYNALQYLGVRKRR